VIVPQGGVIFRKIERDKTTRMSVFSQAWLASDKPDQNKRSPENIVSDFSSHLYSARMMPMRESDFYHQNLRMLHDFNTPERPHTRCISKEQEQLSWPKLDGRRDLSPPGCISEWKISTKIFRGSPSAYFTTLKHTRADPLAATEDQIKATLKVKRLVARHSKGVFVTLASIHSPDPDYSR